MGRYEDHRGVIQDMFGTDTFEGPIDAVTHITTYAGEVRGNHLHEKTTQWTMVLSGRLEMASGGTVTEMKPGMIVRHVPHDPHAWKALDDTACLVFTRGPRSGENYETDTIRLEEPLL